MSKSPVSSFDQPNSMVVSSSGESFIARWKRNRWVRILGVAFVMYLLAFVVYLIAFCWSYAAASAWRVWLTLLGGGAAMTALGAWLAPLSA